MHDPPLILSLETATPGGSVCLVRGSVVLGFSLGDPQISHSNSLLRDINHILSGAGLSVQDVDLFAVTSGPGSFTGLRIGLATVKALASTLSRPCAGISTLQSIACAAGPSGATVALLPAGRGEVFAQLLSVSGNGEVTEADTASHLSPQKMLDKYGSLATLKWAGEGAHINRDSIRDYAQENGLAFREDGLSRPAAVFEQGWSLAPRERNLAKHVAELASRKYQSGQETGTDSLKAIYVRPADAKLKEQCR